MKEDTNNKDECRSEEHIEEIYSGLPDELKGTF